MLYFLVRRGVERYVKEYVEQYCRDLLTKDNSSEESVTKLTSEQLAGLDEIIRKRVDDSVYSILMSEKHKNELVAKVETECLAKISSSMRDLYSGYDSLKYSLNQQNNRIEFLLNENQCLKESNIECLKLIKELQDKLDGLDEKLELLGKRDDKNKGEDKASGDEIKPVCGRTEQTEEAESPAEISVLPEPLPEPIVHKPIFVEDEDLNLEKLSLFLDETKKLREQMASEFSGEDNIDMVLKLVDKGLASFEKLYTKAETSGLSSEKLAGDTKKALKQSVMKVISQRIYQPAIDSYLEKCGLRKLDWTVGKTLSDDDYEYLGDPIIFGPVDDPALNGSILEVIENTYIIDYEEDDEVFESVLSGIYKLGKYAE